MTVQYESAFNTALAQSLKASGSDTTILLAAVPLTVTSGDLRIGSGNNVEWVSFTGVSGTMVTGVTRGLKKNATSSTDAQDSNKKNNAVGAVVKLVAHSRTLNQKANLDTSNVHTAGLTSFTSITEAGFKLQNVTTAQRVALTGLANGVIVYDTNLGEHYQYIGGAWSVISSGSTQPNASTTVAGKVEIATSAESIAGTDTGGTGALLSVLPSNIAKNVQNQANIYGADAGGDDTYAITVTPAITAYAIGQRFSFTSTTGNTGAATLNVSGLGAISIKKFSDQNLETGDIEANQMVDVIYDGTNFEMQSPVASQMSTANSNTLTAGSSSNANSLHIHPEFTQFKAATDAIIISTATLGTTSTANQIGAVLYVDAAVSYASWSFLIPVGATSISSIKTSYEAINAGVVEVIFNTATYSRGSGIVPTYDGNGSFVDQTSSGTDGRISQVTANADSYNGLTITAGNILSVTVGRNGNVGADTYTATWRVVGVEVIFA